MDNFNFLQKCFHLQHTIMYDGLIDLNFATIGYSKTDSSPFWNLALVDKVLNQNEILQIEDSLREHKRNPTIYFENKNELGQLENILKTKDYKKNFEDSWQFWVSRKKVDKKYFNSVKKVIDKAGLKRFLETFNRCYQKTIFKIPMGS